jgi:hypothetical protein
VTTVAAGTPTRPVEFPNWHSRLLLKGVFERQYNVPEDPPWVLEQFLTFYERQVMRIDLSGIAVDRPIFILGLPRSGTTMLQDLCCALPEVGHFTNAMHQFPRCFCAAETWRKRLRLDARGERYVGDSVVVSAGTPNEGLKFFGTWFGWNPHNLRYTPRATESFTDTEIEQIHQTIKRVLWCFRPHARRFFNKNPGLIPDVAILNRVFPDGKFVHLVRDPRNCANSMLKLYWADRRQLEFIRSRRRHGIYDAKPFIPYPRVPHLQEFVDEFGEADVRTTAHIWRESVELLDDYKHNFRHYYQVRFEDILTDSEGEMRRLLEFCELPTPREENALYRERFHKIGIVAHKNQYTAFDVIEDICHEPMRRLEYR